MHLSCTKRNRFGFSLVELLVVVSVLATLSIVAYASAQSIQTGRYNAKRVADVTSLSSAVETHLMQNKVLPDPTANRQYYDTFGGYEHSASGAYGVTSSFSEDILGKTSVANHPKDPDTGSYYAYGKLLKYAPQYQIGAVLRIDGTPTAYIRGSYDREELKSLIKGYNTSAFTTDGATDNLPYDPYKKQVTAYVVESSGSVSITPAKPTTSPLTTWDTVIVSTGWLALVKVSDGTELIVGSASSETHLKLQNLKLKDESGLLTQVRAVLGSGEVLAKAPKLRESGSDRSDLEIETGTAVAAVRGTIFEVSAGGGGVSPSYTLVEGSIQLSASETSGSALQVYIPWGATPSQNTITVNEWQNPIRVTIPPATGPNQTVSPNGVDSDELERIQRKLEMTQWLEQSVIIPDSITFTGSISANGDGSGMTGSLSLNQLNGADLTVRVNGHTGSLVHSSTDMVEFPAASPDWVYKIAYCKTGISGIKCSREFKINIPNPQPWTISLNGLKPRTLTDTLQKEVLANREDICDFEKDPTLFACVDYRTGTWTLRMRDATTQSVTYMSWVTFDENGATFPTQGAIGLKYSLPGITGGFGWVLGARWYIVELWLNESIQKKLQESTSTLTQYALFDWGRSGAIRLLIENWSFCVTTKWFKEIAWTSVSSTTKMCMNHIDQIPESKKLILSTPFINSGGSSIKISFWSSEKSWVIIDNYLANNFQPIFWESISTGNKLISGNNFWATPLGGDIKYLKIYLP